MTAFRKMGIAFGSLVAAWLVIWLVGGQTLGMLAGIAVIVLGALIYRDILLRDRPSKPERREPGGANEAP
jgi:hypothetical protein